MNKQDELLDWVAENVPVSKRFDDPYYSKADGRAEANHVFINGNSLPWRWKNCDQITIAELGFGTGLNFLETVFQWQNLPLPRPSLQFISFEQFPIDLAAMENALSAWKELSQLAGKLMELWKPNSALIDEQFLEGIRLNVQFGDANNTLPHLKFRADAWYLDGFSPAKNIELWNLELMQQVYLHTAPGGTFATYSAAGWVRRNLENAGFTVQKTPGYSGKRHMSIGRRA